MNLFILEQQLNVAMPAPEGTDNEKTIFSMAGDWLTAWLMGHLESDRRFFFAVTGEKKLFLSFPWRLALKYSSLTKGLDLANSHVLWVQADRLFKKVYASNLFIYFADRSWILLLQFENGTKIRCSARVALYITSLIFVAFPFLSMQNINVNSLSILVHLFRQ